MIIYSRTALAQDVNGNLTKLKTTGPERDSVKTYDENSIELLKSIENQMKILNFHMSVITENFLEEN